MEVQELENNFCWLMTNATFMTIHLRFSLFSWTRHLRQNVHFYKYKYVMEVHIRDNILSYFVICC